MKEKEKLSEVLIITTMADAVADAKAILAAEVAVEDVADAEDAVRETITKRMSCVTIVTKRVNILLSALRPKRNMQTWYPKRISKRCSNPL